MAEVGAPVLATAVPSLGNLLSEEWGVDMTVKDMLCKLQIQLMSLHTFLGDASGLRPDLQLQADEVRELLHAMETRLHSFVMRMELTKGTLLATISKKIINHEIVSYIEDAQIKVQEVRDRHRTYRCKSSLESTSTRKVGPVGIPGAVDDIAKQLSRGDLVSIVGLGGMGKTTLARAVYNKMKKKGGFDCYAFVCIGPRADMKKFLTDIFDEFHIEIHVHAPDQDQLISQLQNFLADKRFLFVIDDIWDEEAWAFIKHACVGSAGSKIITTTRNLKVAQGLGGAVYTMKLLSPADSEELLLRTKAEAQSHDVEFDKVSNKILRKCGGVLSYSYYDIPYNIKRCFLYLNLFPEDHWIDKNMLIWRWVAEGLVPDGLFETGETYFNELIDRSMIQWAVSPRDVGQGGCRVHGLMRDLIRDLSISENFSTRLGMKQERTSQTGPIHRLAIHKGHDRNTRMELGEVLSLYASMCHGSSLPSLQRFKQLRVIDLEACDLSVRDCKLKDLRKLKGLKYVGLVGTPIAELPRDIGGLELLQTLDVTATGIRELPPFIGELRKLRCLRAGKGTRMKGRVGKLTSLEELWLYSADKSPDFAAELRKLSRMRVLVIHFDEMDKDLQEVLAASLQELKKLQVLQIWSDAEEKVRLMGSWEGSVPSSQLHQLLLFRIILPRPMAWICRSHVPKLSKLLLQVETLETEHLEILGQMPSLCSLCLHCEGHRLSYTASRDEFQVLEYLNTNIELICGAGALPWIQELEVGGIRVGIDVGLQGNMPLLERATYHLDCQGCCGHMEVHKAEEELREAAKAHPNRPTLCIKRWNNFELEMHHQFIRPVVRALAEEMHHHQFIINNSSGIVVSPAFANVLSDCIARAVGAIGAPPTLSLGDATDGKDSSSQGSDIAVQTGIIFDQAAAHRKMSNDVQQLLNTKIAARMGSRDGPLSSSEIYTTVELIMSEVISHYSQNEPEIVTVNSKAIPMMLNLLHTAQASSNGSSEVSDKVMLINSCLAYDSMTVKGQACLRSSLEKGKRRQNPEPYCVSSVVEEMDWPGEGQGEDEDANLAENADACVICGRLRPKVDMDSALSWVKTPVGAAYGQSLICTNRGTAAGEMLPCSEGMQPTGLTMGLLEKITRNFSEERVLGQGGYGKVYLGVHENGQKIAVKLLYNNMQTIDDKQFKHEFENLIVLKHQNIVRLVGYCYETQHQHMEFEGRHVFGEITYKALCFEYMPRGSLQKHLFGNETTPLKQNLYIQLMSACQYKIHLDQHSIDSPFVYKFADDYKGLDWQTRYKIIKGTCQGLKYLHEGFKDPFYHLDLKPDNILLDENMAPKLADFGLSKFYGGEQTRVTQSPIGTIGYMPPEYLFGSKVSKKYDIFSLGVVMIKIIAGLSSHGIDAEMQQEFLDQVQGNWRKKLQPTWSSTEPLEAQCQQVKICAEIALRCMDKDMYNRPCIVDIIHDLDKTEIFIENITYYEQDPSPPLASTSTVVQPAASPSILFRPSPASFPIRSSAQPQRPPQKVPSMVPPPPNSHRKGLFSTSVYGKPPDGLLAITEHVYVLDSCFNTNIFAGDKHQRQQHVRGILSHLKSNFADACFLVSHFKEGWRSPTLEAKDLTSDNMIVMEYPRQYEGCSVLTIETIHNFLMVGNTWLSLGQHNILIMHCERGGWPVLAFMLAGLLLYQKKSTDEQKTLEMVYKQAPHELIQLLSPLNPMPTQIRYLQYISERNINLHSSWLPADRPLTLDYVVLRSIPDFNGEAGCSPIFRIYGQDPLSGTKNNPKAEDDMIKIDVHCHIQGDVVLECTSIDADKEREETMFRVMFNTSFIRSDILMLDRDEIDRCGTLKIDSRRTSKLRWAWKHVHHHSFRTIAENVDRKTRSWLMNNYHKIGIDHVITIIKQDQKHPVDALEQLEFIEVFGFDGLLVFSIACALRRLF
ncbi:Formin-like protein 6 [Triticum urartu]|uniref:non-specific serine/threonine protein kinase n=1 Tax=Triticum urartu TaxID=4572 RepID=M7ZY82_TRIUA|nr:Formin-like protein 6 [Triticum urartu]